MSEYRRITQSCCERDWNAATHDEVVAKNPGNELLGRFLDKGSIDSCHAGGNVLDRSRDSPKGQSPGPHAIGNLHVKAPEARRAWLWRDTGELDSAVGDLTIDWMIAEGPRRRGERSDLQESHADILFDPDDTWLPTEDDYAALADHIAHGWIDRASDAIAHAARVAEANRGEMIPVDIDQIDASVAQSHGITITIVEEYAERWVIIDRLRTDKQVVDYEEAFLLATAAFHGIPDEDIEEIFETTEILDGRELIEPAKSYAWCAVV